MKSLNQWEELQKLENILLKDNIRLTRQELRVLYETMDGKGNAEIAQFMHLCLGAIKTHKNNLIAKLGLKGKEEFRKYVVKLTKNLP
jgi:DNA-binding NarL/FixJ family response regulator